MRSSIITPTDDDDTRDVGAFFRLTTLQTNVTTTGSYSLYLWGHKDSRDNDDEDDTTDLAELTQQQQQQATIKSSIVANSGKRNAGGAVTRTTTLADCLDDYNNNNNNDDGNITTTTCKREQSIITMLHLRAIENIDSSTEALERFLSYHSMCRRIWIENCTIMAPSLTNHNIFLRLLSLMVPGYETTATATATQSAAAAETCSIILKDQDQREDQQLHSTIVEEFIIEGPSLTSNSLEAILTSLESPFCSLKQLTIQQWEQDDAAEDNSDKFKTIINTLLSTSLPYRLLEMQQQQHKATCLRQVTLRGLRLIQENPTTSTTMASTTRSMPCINSDGDCASRAAASSYNNTNRNATITHWDISGCYFPQNDPACLLRALLELCPSLQFFRMDSNDILWMGGPRNLRPRIQQKHRQQQHQQQTHQALLAKLFQRVHRLDLSWEDSKVQQQQQQYIQGELAPIVAAPTRETTAETTLEFNPEIAALDEANDSEEPQQQQAARDDDMSRLAQIVGDAFGAASSSWTSDAYNYAIDSKKHPRHGLVELRLCRNFWATRDLFRLFFYNASVLQEENHQQLQCWQRPLVAPTVSKAVPSVLSTLKLLDLTCCNIITPRLLVILHDLLPQLTRLRQLYLGYNPIFQRQENDDDDDDETDVGGRIMLSSNSNILSEILKSVRLHPCLILVSLEGNREIPLSFQETLLYYTSIKRCHRLPRYHDGGPYLYPKEWKYNQETELALNSMMSPSVSVGESGSKENPIMPQDNINYDDDQHHQPSTALWPLVLDHCRFVDYNDIGITLPSRCMTNNGSYGCDSDNNPSGGSDSFPSRRAQANAIYHLLQIGGPFLDDVILSRQAQ